MPCTGFKAGAHPSLYILLDIGTMEEDPQCINFPRSQKLLCWNRENRGSVRCRNYFEKTGRLLGRSKVEKYIWGNVIRGEKSNLKVIFLFNEERRQKIMLNFPCRHWTKYGSVHAGFPQQMPVFD